MRIGLPLTVSTLLLLVAPQSVSSQPIFRPFSGERGIEMVRDIAEKDLISKMGKPCGDYFLFEKIGDDQILSFKVAVTKKEERLATTSLLRLALKLIVIEIDDQKMVPTAAFIKPEPESGERIRLLIRMSRHDYGAADCLPRPGT